MITEQTSDGLYHMYFGDSVFYHATSSDLLNWTASAESFATPMNPWENGLIEPGPAPVKTRDGRWLLVGVAFSPLSHIILPKWHSPDP